MALEAQSSSYAYFTSTLHKLIQPRPDNSIGAAPSAQIDVTGQGYNNRRCGLKPVAILPLHTPEFGRPRCGEPDRSDDVAHPTPATPYPGAGLAVSVRLTTDQVRDGDGKDLAFCRTALRGPAEG
ncbi:hypothetical protein BV898_03392 [Hypsibius exemplaris]|uniref:Uncharacterized protein n=1 Tax=Hypsibius exemplaris TaxID=2072580 RepID=A0A1W0X4X8_HYPEX|nr:hypothetical protein BV898_03392 [Hypsibius exemplaris]